MGQVAKFLVVVFLLMSSSPVFASDTGKYIPSRDELTELIERFRNELNEKFNSDMPEMQFNPQDPSLGVGLVGQYTKVLGWQSTATYEVLVSGQVDSRLYIYTTRLPEGDENLEDVLLRVLQNADPEQNSYPRFYPTPQKNLNGAEQMYHLFQDLERSQEVTTASVGCLFRIGRVLAMVEVNKDWTDESAETIMPELVFWPAIFLMIEKMQKDQQPDPAQLKMI